MGTGKYALVVRFVESVVKYTNEFILSSMISEIGISRAHKNAVEHAFVLVQDIEVTIFLELGSLKWVLAVLLMLCRR